MAYGDRGGGGPSVAELPLVGLLRSWLRGSAGGIMLIVEGDIPLWLKRKSPVVDLIEEWSPDESSNDRKSFWRVVPDHVCHRDPTSFCVLRPCAGRPSLHRRCRRRRHKRGLGRVLGADPHNR